MFCFVAFPCQHRYLTIRVNNRNGKRSIFDKRFKVQCSHLWWAEWETGKLSLEIFWKMLESTNYETDKVICGLKLDKALPFSKLVSFMRDWSGWPHSLSYERFFIIAILRFVSQYCIRPNYRPCPHNRPPPWLFTLFSLIIAHLTIFFLTFYFIFTYRPLDDLLALVVENKFT